MPSALAREQLGHGEDRTDAHLVGLAAGDGEAAERAEWLQPAPLGKLGFHHHAGRRAVGQLAGVAGGDPLAFAHRLERGEPFERGVGAVALVAHQRHRLKAFRLGVLVDDFFGGRQRHDLVVEALGLLACRRPALAFQRIGILRFAADLVALGHRIGGVDHRHID